ncbi:MAG: type II toxin-antitoxin system RatA family toxin [Proteobacteria bacterium]|nr:type II toxin-antitoxin system RatA family toxin [Pseudomonadota bacterium]
MMTVIYRVAVVPFSAQQMFDLVNDVAQYPQFLPWCADAQIAHQTQTHMEASLCIQRGLLSKTFTTLNRLIPHERIEMRLRQGPFKHLEGVWQFQNLANGTQVSFHLSFEFINPLFSITLGPIFNQVAQSLVQAFTQRANQVYVHASA